MRFHLVYSGPLSGSGNSSKKPSEVLEIRRRLSAQLKYLWDVDASLKRLRQDAIVVKDPAGRLTTAHSPVEVMRDLEKYPAQDYEIDLCQNLQFKGSFFQPLVRESLRLNCELDILFLRQEDPGSLVLQGGDLDNRIKTLFDALRMPCNDDRPKEDQDEETVFTLLESDTLVSALKIDTARLLFPSTTKPNEVHLVIEVKLKVLDVGPWNICLL